MAKDFVWIMFVQLLITPICTLKKDCQSDFKACPNLTHLLRKFEIAPISNFSKKSKCTSL